MQDGGTPFRNEAYTKNPEALVSDEGHQVVDAYIQDQYTAPIIIKFHRVDNISSLTVATEIGDNSITIEDATDFVASDYAIIYSTETTRYYLGEIISITGNVIGLDSPIDSEFPVGASFTSGPSNLGVDGSTTSQTFGLRGQDVLPDGVDLSFDITRIIMHAVTADSVDLSKFADIDGGLTYGLILRKRNGTYNNIFNVKTNGEMTGIMYDFTVDASTNPVQGQDGFYGRLTFSGQNKIGVTIRLEKGEDLEIIVQDDLSSITSFEITAEGHVVE